MYSEYAFLRIYRSLAKQEADKKELYELYRDLSSRVEGNEKLRKFFDQDTPDSLTVAIAIDAVAHEIHANSNEVLQTIFPGANYQIVKSELDELAGLESKNEIRKFNRGYFTTLLSDSTLLFLEKQQVGMTTKEDIVDAIKEYEKLHKAGIASKAEVLTLARYYPDDNKYRQIVIAQGLEEEDKEPLIVGGPASVELVDKEGHLITTEALEDAFERFMSNFRTRNSQIFHSDVQIGWILPAYINKNGQVFKSGVDDKGLWVITEVRDDSKIAERVKDEIQKGNIQSYSIAGSATETENMTKGVNSFTQVNGLDLAEITLCAKGVNQGAHFDILKSIPEEPQAVSTSDILDIFASEEPNELSNYAVVLETNDEASPTVVICSDRRNSITDEIYFRLQKMLPENTPIIVKPLSLVNKFIPVYNINVEHLDTSIEKQEKVYFQPEKGEKAPEGSKIERGPKGGNYYEVTPRPVTSVPPTEAVRPVAPEEAAYEHTERMVNAHARKKGFYQSLREQANQRGELESFDKVGFVLHEYARLAHEGKAYSEVQINRLVRALGPVLFKPKYFEEDPEERPGWEKETIKEYRKIAENPRGASRLDKVIAIDNILGWAHQEGLDLAGSLGIKDPTLIHATYKNVIFPVLESLSEEAPSPSSIEEDGEDVVKSKQSAAEKLGNWARKIETPLSKDVAVSTDPGVFTPTFGSNTQEKIVPGKVSRREKAPFKSAYFDELLQELGEEVKDLNTKISKTEGNSAISAFSSWITKHCPEHRSELHRRLLDEYGFPEEVKLEDERLPVPEEFPEPWVVNEAGEESWNEGGQ